MIKIFTCSQLITCPYSKSILLITGHILSVITAPLLFVAHRELLYGLEETPTILTSPTSSLHTVSLIEFNSRLTILTLSHRWIPKIRSSRLQPELASSMAPRRRLQYLLYWQAIQLSHGLELEQSASCRLDIF